MEPLSPKVLNIQIVSMRKEVKRAIVHLIHSLTRKISQLRIKKGTEEEKKKNATKADYHVSEVFILKKLKADDVSMFALSHPTNKKFLANLIAKQVMSQETRVMAKLCLRDNLQKIVNEFKDKYSESIELMNDLINERYSKSETKTKKKKKTATPKKPLTEKQQKTNKPAESNEDSSESSDSVPVLVKIKSENSSNASPGSEGESEDENSSNIGNNSEDNTAESESESDNFNEQENDEKNINIYQKEKKIPKNKLVNKDFQLKAMEKSASLMESGNKTEKKSQRKVDPFFKTKDDMEYLTYCDVKASESADNSSPHKEQDTESQSENIEDDQDEVNEINSFKGGYGRGSRGGGSRGSFRGRQEGNSFKGRSPRGSFRGRPDGNSFRGGRFGSEHDRNSFRGQSPRGNSRGSFRGSFRGRQDGDSSRGGFRGSFRGRQDGDSSRGGFRGSFRGRQDGDSSRGGFRGSSRGRQDGDSFRGGSFRGRQDGDSSRGGFRGRQDGGSSRGGFRGRQDVSLKRNEGEKSTSLGSKIRKFSEPNRAERRAENFNKTNNPEKTVLHPSWEAKKNLNKGVVPFQGKKIVFEN